MKKVFYFNLIFVFNYVESFAILPVNHWMTKFDTYVNGLNYEVNNPSCTRLLVSGYTKWHSLSVKGNVLTEAGKSGFLCNEDAFADLANGMNSLLSAYEATGDLKYLDTVMVYAKNIKNSAHAITPGEINDGIDPPNYNLFGYDGWHQNNDGKSSITEEIKPFRYILKMCRIITQNRNILPANYINDALLLVQFVEKNVWQKWSAYTDCNYYLRLADTHISCNWTFIAVELKYILNSLNLGASFGTQSYINQINWYNLDLLSNLEANGNAIKFKQRVSSGQPKFDDDENACIDKYIRNTANDACKEVYDDVSHANYVISYIIESMELNNSLLSFNVHINGLINTVKNVLWKGCNGAPYAFNDFVDGHIANQDDLDCNDGKDSEGTGNNQSEGWVKLARYSCSLQELYEDYSACSSPEYVRFQNEQFYANMALNAARLEGFKSNPFLNLPNTTFIDNINSTPVPSSHYISTTNTMSVANSNATTFTANTDVEIEASEEIHIYPGIHIQAGSNTHFFINNNYCISPLARMASSSNNSEDSTTEQSSSIPNLNDEVYASAAPTQYSNPSPKKSKNENIRASSFTEDTKFTIQPNPNNGTFDVHFSTPENEIYNLEICDVLGQTVYETTSTEPILHLKLENSKAGVYFVKVQNENAVFVKKIIVN